MFDQHRNTHTTYSIQDERRNLSILDSQIVQNMTYYELLKKFDRNEVEIDDLNLRM